MTVRDLQVRQFCFGATPACEAHPSGFLSASCTLGLTDFRGTGLSRIGLTSSTAFIAAALETMTIATWLACERRAMVNFLCAYRSPPPRVAERTSTVCFGHLERCAQHPAMLP